MLLNRFSHALPLVDAELADQEVYQMVRLALLIEIIFLEGLVVLKL